MDKPMPFWLYCLIVLALLTAASCIRCGAHLIKPIPDDPPVEVSNG